MPDLFKALEASPIADALKAFPTLYALVNAAHIISIGLIVGAILPLDLVLLGLVRNAPPAALASFLNRSATVGVGLAVATGLCLFTTRAGEYAANPAFLTKIALLFVGVINALILTRAISWKAVLDGGKPASRVKAAAGVSFLAWVGAVVAGRFIGFV